MVLLLSRSFKYFCMPLPTWGDLAKSSVDPQKINAAVDAAIESHNDDPDAHTDIGQSLQSHRAAEIIDHAARSVLADKFSASEEILESAFSSLDGWCQSGVVNLEGWGYVKIYVEEDVTPTSYICALLLHSGNWLVWDKNHMIQGVFFTDISPDYIIFFSVGDIESLTVYDGYGFRIEDGVVKGFLRTNLQNSLTDDLDVDCAHSHVYRALYDASARKVYFYVDSVLKASLALVGSPVEYEPRVYFYANSKDTSDGNLKISKLTISRQE